MRRSVCGLVNVFWVGRVLAGVVEPLSAGLLRSNVRWVGGRKTLTIRRDR